MENTQSKCNLCPRECNVDRNKTKGFCGMQNDLVCARAALHMWEEPCISGSRGSGTVFFSGCTLRCVYCQNREIANGRIGKEISVNRLAEIFLELQDKKANNINLVTPTHYTDKIIEALKLAKDRGLKIPVVYNTSGYEKVETLKKLEGLVDVYLPDFKYIDSQISSEYSAAPDYFEYAFKAIKEMVRQTGLSFFKEDDELVVQGYVEEGIMKSGVIVRHLILPGAVNDSKKIIKLLYETFSDEIFMSIMSQYTPLEAVADHKTLNRTLTEEEYDEVVDFAIELGLTNAFIQEGEAAQESFIPRFDCEGI